jgi:ABC-type sulfate transport system permease subunit
VFQRAFQTGSGLRGTVTTPAAKHALLVTLIIAAIAVPANTIFDRLRDRDRPPPVPGRTSST